MNRILYISLSVILFISCGNKDREILVKLMQEWKGREILYPNDMHFFYARSRYFECRFHMYV